MDKKILSVLFILGVATFLVFVQFSPNSTTDDSKILSGDEKEAETVSSGEEIDPEIGNLIEAKADLIKVEDPALGAQVNSPLSIVGQARGYWFFEASFPVVLTDWDGRIIAEGYASADGEWMTEDFVPFTAELMFESPYQAGDPDFMKRGALILKKDNPSGLPEHDDAIEIPIYFKAEQ